MVGTVLLWPLEGAETGRLQRAGIDLGVLRAGNLCYFFGILAMSSGIHSYLLPPPASSSTTFAIQSGRQYHRRMSCVHELDLVIPNIKEFL
ncbi:unnamed protein product [Nezara viridula]|uniref:Uncharacterized protein n=1 Tax=Nezara viridula TaxID=85310 RepID=A0A9P0HQQ5_NEZVI|nr:unnamed protein product [Nezara viridula]